MSPTEEAIKRAIEGGYKRYSVLHTAPINYESKIFNECFLDPEFWKCLGKSEGWIFEEGKWCGKKGCGNDGQHRHSVGRIQWKEEWHRFIDHLISGGTAEEFFNT